MSTMSGKPGRARPQTKVKSHYHQTGGKCFGEQSHGISTLTARHDMNSIASQFTNANRDGLVQERNEVAAFCDPQVTELAPTMQLPPISQPTAFLRAHTDDASNPDCKIKIAHGTTTLAFRFQGGIVIAVDSRASQGNWTASQTVHKVIRINPFLLGTMAGGAADCQYWETWLGTQCRLHELREKERISVAAASKILCNLVYQYKGMGLSMGTMICGVNEKEGPTVYYVDGDGTRLKGDVFCVGSGQTFAYGVLDSEYKWDLTVEEALYLGKRSILAAAHRDAYSGGSINLYHIAETGWTYHGNFDVGEIFWEVKEKEKSFNNVLG